jgi:ATP-dependent Lon protease
MSQDSRTITPEEGSESDVSSPVELPVGGRPARDTGPAIPEVLPLLPIRNSVIFPGTVMPLGVNREKSKRLMDAVLAGESKMLAVATQKDAETEDPGFDDIYRTGVACLVMKLLRMRDGSQNAIIHGLVRIRVEQLLQTEPYLTARISVIQPEVSDNNQLQAMVHSVRVGSQRVIELSPNIPDEAISVLSSIEDPSALADFVAANLAESVEERQNLLETTDVQERLRKVNDRLAQRIDVLEMSKKIQDQARGQIEKAQREYFLQEQLKAIQKELGEQDSRQAEAEDLRKRVKEARMPQEVQAEVDRQLQRLERIPQASPEYSVSRDHIEWLISLPWAKSTEDNLDINRAAAILDEDHYDLERVKKRILEFLAVRKLQPTGRGPILCLLGPPGVGKTSLGQSIARALGRKFIRMSLGGIRDEADIRGHRRTYIGAMPGRIIQEIRAAGSNNAVFMLDEVDKIGVDFRGDPASALLEVLDPEQNRNFVDHYLGVPFDLSKTLFIGTANWADPIPPPLRDRMEVIDIPGYTIIEKTRIARRYLIPRQLSQNGLKPEQLEITDEALDDIIASYTREAGVRNLEREIAAACRVAAADIARKGPSAHRVTRQNLCDYLGPPKFVPETALRAGVPGVVTGMAYTPTGGEIIFIEATAMPGTGNLILTGQIGNVMRESAQAAFSLVRSRAAAYPGAGGRNGLRKQDIHIHVPAGAVPKDGPSAGVAMFTALVSLLSNKPARADVSMTGEITLRGIVLPIGGVKEKVLAAHRAGIRTVILPKQNEKDLAEVHKEVRKDMHFHFVDTVDKVIKIALTEPPAKAPAARIKRRVAKGKTPSAGRKQRVRRAASRRAAGDRSANRGARLRAAGK